MKKLDWWQAVERFPDCQQQNGQKRVDLIQRNATIVEASRLRGDYACHKPVEIVGLAPHLLERVLVVWSD
ncbi:hypothetical protein [Lysinibacter cavernae]|uniref:Uncharacterized protein n=1 Tax=Lysinibacter cavernae TaxID=1640652 RepID=A0A7X5QYN4_9MICO|nr:hypothetical protein [Lysinibacter cavernae]NIH52424.1 hypothetical protein [Lysinibacter cavernae]